MEFFIKKNATLPLLKMQVVKDGRSDYNNMMKFIEESAIFFSMVDTDTGIPKISTRPCGFVEKILIEPNAAPEYYVYYQFTQRDTNRPGRYLGQFLFRNDQGTLVLPIRDELFINVQESFVADDLPYESCYVVEFPCCVEPGPILITPTPTSTQSPCPSCPVCTPTPTPNITPTPPPTPVPLNLNLNATIQQGSVIITYLLEANQNVNQETAMFFNHTLGTYTGSPISTFTGVTISSGDFSGETIVTIDENFDNLTRIDTFGNIVVVPTSAYWEITENYPSTPTPTPTTTLTPTPTVTITSTPIPTPTPTVTPITPPTNDFQFIDIPNNDLSSFFISNNDLSSSFIPINNINWELILTNDLISTQIPNKDILTEFIPNNDLSFENLNCEGKQFNLVVLPWIPPSSGDTIFPGLSGMGGIGITNPNTFDVDAVYWSVFDNQGNEVYTYFSNLGDEFILSFTQNGNTSVYSGTPLCIGFNDFGGNFSFFSDPISVGTLPLTLLEPSPNNFNLVDPVCISYVNLII